MKSMPSWFTTAVVIVALVGLTACKSRKRCCPPQSACGPAPCAPPTVMQPQPSIAQPTPSYPPPAPSYPVDTTAPAPTASPDLAAANDKADLERARNQDLEAQLRLEQGRLADAEAKLRDMEVKIAEMETPPAGSAEPDLSAGAPIGAADRLMDDLRARSTADVLRDGDMVIVRVTNGFRAGQDLLKQDVQLIQTLNATADALGRYPGATVAVVGHSDTDPIRKSKWSSNDELSMARAQRVAQVLADNGVDRNRISIDGRGAREPLVVPETSASDKAANRRVEIMIRP